MALHSEVSELTLTATLTVAAPLLAPTSTGVSAQEGDDVVLTVPLAAHSGVPTHVTWTRGDVELVGERFSSVTQRGAVTLNVRNATVGDSGRYSLSARNDAGHAHSDLLLEVRTRPGDVPVFLRRLNDLAVKVGTRTRFLVEIRSPTQVKVSWEQEGNPVVESERFHLLHEGNFFCVDVAPVTLADAGLWICRAHNSNGTATCFCHLNVLVPKAYKAPHFLEELVAILTEQGTVSLECKVVGVPTPTLKWFKDNQEIKAGDVFALSADPQDTTSLGTYTCEAINCMGRACSTSRVHVLNKEGGVQPVDSLVPKGPAPVFSKELRNDKVKIGGKLTLSCKVSVPPWPKSITWFNKAGLVESGGRYHVIEDGLGAYSVEVDPVEASDEGEWKCVATSNHGVKGISSCSISVSYPKNYKKPKFLESLKAILTEEGLVSFECKVVGYPTPQLRWFKDGQELKPGDVYQLTGTNSLGSYCCIAKNCMGETSSTAELTVEDIQSQLNEEERLQLFSKNQPPRFLQGLKSLEAKIMDPLRFTVQVSVSPQPSVAWYRDDEEVQESDRYKKEQETKGFCHLSIKRLELMDQAEWKCVATNDYGQSVTSCFLKLSVPRHYKKPRFLENLRAVLSEEGAVNLECKVIGVPQPTLKWYKDGRELKPGDIHRIISGQDGTCCLGTYTCEATNCMGTVASSASLLGFEDRAQVKPQPEPLRPLPPPAAHLVRHPSLSTILEERTSQLHDTVASDERAEVSFSFDGKEVSVSLYETPDLTEEEALQVVEMYAEELSEHISEHNIVELPPMRFVKETSQSGHLLMEAVVIDVSPEYYASAEDRTEADLDEFSITEDNGFMSPQVLTPDEMPFDKFTADFLERTVQLGQKSVPVKPPRKRGADNSESSYHSLKEAKLSPEEESSEFADALSSIKDKSQKDSFSSAKGKAEGSGGKSADKIEAELESRKPEDLKLQRDDKSTECKKSRKKSRSRSRSAEIKSVENVSDTASENKVPTRSLKKRKSTDSEKEDDSLREFERQKSLKAETDKGMDFENIQQKDRIKKSKSSESEKEDDSLQEFESRKSLHRTDKDSEVKTVSKPKILQKKQFSDSSGREDDSLIEYEKKKVPNDGISEKTSSKSEKQERQKAPLSKSISTDSSEKDEEFAIKSEQSEQLRKRKKRSIKKSGSTEKKTDTPETGVEIPPSSEAESCDRDSFKNKKVVSTSDLDRMRSTSDLDSIGDKSRAQEEEEHSADFDTAEDSAYDKSEMSVLESLSHSIKEIKKGLAAVEERVISESTDEPQSAKSSLSAIESLVQPINEIQRGLIEVEKQAEETEAGQYSPSSILETLKEPIQELGRNLAEIEKAKATESGNESLLKKTSQTLLETVSHPLQELQKELTFIHQQAVIETGEESYSDVLHSFKPSLLVVQGGVEQTEGDFTSKIEDLTDVTVLPHGTYAHQTEQTPISIEQLRDQEALDVKQNDLFVPLTVLDVEESLAETVVSLTSLGAFDLHSELELFSEKLEDCLRALNKSAEDTSDGEVKDILISLGKLITPLEQFKNVIEKCLRLVSENDKSNDPQVRSSNMVLKATLESPVHALGKCLNLLETVANTKSSKQIRGLGIKILYKLSFPLEELKTTMKLIENLSEHTSIELLVAPVENLISASSVINLEASKSGFAENIPEEGVFIVRELDDTVEVLSRSVAFMTKSLSSQSSLRTVSSLSKPLADFQTSLHKLENKIKTPEKYSKVTPSEIYNLAQDLCKPLQAMRTELSIAQHEIELDQYSHLSLLPDSAQENTLESATNIIHQSLEQIHKSFLTCTEFVLSKSPSETMYVRYLLFALNELILPLNQLNTSVIKAKESLSEEVHKISEPNVGMLAVTSSASELLGVLSELHHHSLTAIRHPEIQMIQLLCTMEEPLLQVERGLCKLIEYTHVEDKNILNINMLKTLAEPFKCLQKSLINIYEKLASESISQEIFLELRHPIQELQRSILIIQDQVSFEYGDEPASIESNIVTLQSLVNPLNALKKQFMELDNIMIDQTQSTSYSKENKNLHSIIKVSHELQLKISSIMVEENYVNKHSLDSLDMFPIFQDLNSLLRNFEGALRRVDLICQNETKTDINVHNKLCEAVKLFSSEATDFHNKIMLASNKALKDVKHPVHFLQRGTESFITKLADIVMELENCQLNELSIGSCSLTFYQNLLHNFKEFSEFIREMETVREEPAKDSSEMSHLSSSDTIKDVNTIMEEVTQTRVSLESVNISSKKTTLEKVRKEVKTFCELLKSAEDSIIDNAFTKASSLNFNEKDERRILINAFSSMVEQLHKIETCIVGNQEAMESVNYLKNTIEVIQEHLSVGEEISEVYILQNLNAPLKSFKDNISKALDTVSVKSEETLPVSSYLERFEKSASDLELGLMKLEHALLNSTGDFSSLKNIDIDVIAHPIKELVCYINCIEEQKTGFDLSETLVDQSSLSMLKTLAEPIREIQEGVLLIQEQVALEASGKTPSGKSCAGILYDIAKPIRELRSGVALIQEQIVMEPDIEPLSEETRASSLQTFAVPIEEMKKLLSTITEQQPFLFEADVQSMSENISLLKTIAQPVKELQNKLASIEINQIMESGVESLSVKENILALAKPVHTLQEGIAWVESQMVLETTGDDLLFQNSVSMLKEIANPLLEISKGIAVIFEQQFIEEGNVEDVPSVSEMSTLADVADVSLADAAVHVGETVTLEHGLSFQDERVFPQLAITTIEDNLQSGVIEQQQFLLEVDSQVENKYEDAIKYENLNPASSKFVEQEIMPYVQVQEHETLSQANTLTLSEDKTLHVAELTEESLYIGVQAEFQDAVVHLERFSEENTVKESAVVKDVSLNIAAQVDVQEALSNVKALTSDEDLPLTDIEPVTLTPCIIQGELQQSLADVESLETEEDTLESISIQDTSFVFEPHINDIQEALSNVGDLVVTENTLCEAEIKTGIRETAQNESLQTLDKEAHLKSLVMSSEEANISVNTPNIAAETEMQQMISNLDDLKTIKYPTDSANFGEVSLQCALQVECQQILSDAESLKTVSASEKYSQAMTLEESHINVAVKTQVQQFCSVVEQIEAVKNELQVKVTHEPLINETAKQELQQVLQIAEDIISLKEEIQANMIDNPNVNIELPDIKKVLSTCEEVKHLKDTVQEISQEHPEIDKDIENILSLAKSLEKSKESPLMNIPKESNKKTNVKQSVDVVSIEDLITEPSKTISENQPVAVLPAKQDSSAQEEQLLSSDMTLQDKELPAKESSFKQAIETQLQQFITAVEDVSYSVNALEAKLISDPAINYAVQQEFQEILSTISDIKTIKNILQVPTKQEESARPSQDLTSQVEIQQVLLACNSFEKLKETVEAKLSKELKVYSAIESELQQILLTADSFQIIKQSLTVNITELEALHGATSFQVDNILSSNGSETGKEFRRDDEVQRSETNQCIKKNKDASAELKVYTKSEGKEGKYIEGKYQVSPELQITETLETTKPFEGNETEKDHKHSKESILDIEIEISKDSELKQEDVRDSQINYEGEQVSDVNNKVQIKPVEEKIETKEMGDSKVIIESGNVQIEPDVCERKDYQEGIQCPDIIGELKTKSQSEVNNKEASKVNDETKKTIELRKRDETSKTDLKVADTKEAEVSVSKTLNAAKDNDVFESESENMNDFDTNKESVKDDIEQVTIGGGAGMVKTPNISNVEDNKSNEREEKSEPNNKSKQITQIDELKQAAADKNDVNKEIENKSKLTKGTEIRKSNEEVDIKYDKLGTKSTEIIEDKTTNDTNVSEQKKDEVTEYKATTKIGLEKESNHSDKSLKPGDIATAVNVVENTESEKAVVDKPSNENKIIKPESEAIDKNKSKQIEAQTKPAVETVVMEVKASSDCKEKLEIKSGLEEPNVKKQKGETKEKKGKISGDQTEDVKTAERKLKDVKETLEPQLKETTKSTETMNSKEGEVVKAERKQAVETVSVELKAIKNCEETLEITPGLEESTADTEAKTLGDKCKIEKIILQEEQKIPIDTTSAMKPLLDDSCVSKDQEKNSSEPSATKRDESLKPKQIKQKKTKDEIKGIDDKVANIPGDLADISAVKNKLKDEKIRDVKEKENPEPQKQEIKEVQEQETYKNESMKIKNKLSLGKETICTEAMDTNESIQIEAQTKPAVETVGMEVKASNDCKEKLEIKSSLGEPTTSRENKTIEHKGLIEKATQEEGNVLIKTKSSVQPLLDDSCVSKNEEIGSESFITKKNVTEKGESSKPKEMEQKKQKGETKEKKGKISGDQTEDIKTAERKLKDVKETLEPQLKQTTKSTETMNSKDGEVVKAERKQAVETVSVELKAIKNCEETLEITPGLEESTADTEAKTLGDKCKIEKIILQEEQKIPIDTTSAMKPLLDDSCVSKDQEKNRSEPSATKRDESLKPKQIKQKKTEDEIKGIDDKVANIPGDLADISAVKNKLKDEKIRDVKEKENPEPQIQEIKEVKEQETFKKESMKIKNKLSLEKETIHTGEEVAETLIESKTIQEKSYVEEHKKTETEEKKETNDNNMKSQIEVEKEGDKNVEMMVIETAEVQIITVEKGINDQGKILSDSKAAKEEQAVIVKEVKDSKEEDKTKKRSEIAEDTGNTMKEEIGGANVKKTEESKEGLEIITEKSVSNIVEVKKKGEDEVSKLKDEKVNNKKEEVKTDSKVAKKEDNMPVKEKEVKEHIKNSEEKVGTKKISKTTEDIDTKMKEDIKVSSLKKDEESKERLDVSNIVEVKKKDEDEVSKLKDETVNNKKEEVKTDSKVAKKEDNMPVKEKEVKEEHIKNSEEKVGTKKISKTTEDIDTKMKEGIKVSSLKKDEESKERLDVSSIVEVKKKDEDEVSKLKDEKVNNKKEEVKTDSKVSKKEDNMPVKEKEVKEEHIKNSEEKVGTKKISKTTEDIDTKMKEDIKVSSLKKDEEIKERLDVTVNKNLTSISEISKLEEKENLATHEKGEGKLKKIKQETTSETVVTQGPSTTMNKDMSVIDKVTAESKDGREDTKPKSTMAKETLSTKEEKQDNQEMNKVSSESDTKKIKDDVESKKKEQKKCESKVTKKSELKKEKREVGMKKDEKSVKENNEIKPDEELSEIYKIDNTKNGGTVKIQNSEGGKDTQIEVNDIKIVESSYSGSEIKSKTSTLIEEVGKAHEIKEGLEVKKTEISKIDASRKTAQMYEIEKEFEFKNKDDIQDKSSLCKTTASKRQDAVTKKRSSKKQRDKLDLDDSSKDVQRKQTSTDSEVKEKLFILEKEEDKHKIYVDESSTSDYGSESYSEPYQIKKSQSYDTRQWVYDSKSGVEDVTTRVTPKGVRERKYEVSGLAEHDKIAYTSRQSTSKPVFCGRLVDRTASQGSKLKVTCSLTGTPDPTVQWFKDGHPVDTSRDHRIRTRLSNGLASLEIVEAKVGDSGKYTCSARNTHGEASTTATIKVFSYLESAPEAPVFTQHIRDHYKSASDELVIECRVKGHPQPTVVWTKDGQPLRPLARYEQSVLTDGTCCLTIHGPEAGDSGLYKCVAENAVWSEQTSAHVMFQGREKYIAESRSLADPKLPRFTNIVSDTVVREGGTVALQVAVKGTPRAEVTWYRGSEPLPKRSSRFRYLEDAGVYSLVMTDASVREAGTYTCRASNAHGFRDTSVNVEIVGSSGASGLARGKPAMFTSRPDTSMSIAGGEDVSFSFRISGDPKPRVTWMKGMKDITNNIRALKETVNDYVRLTLKHATVMDAGTYFIMAKNIYGADHAFVTVRVKQRARSLTPTRATIWSGPDTSTILRDIHESARALVNDVPGPISSAPAVSDCGKNWLSLSWGKPDHRGAAPVLAYRVEAWLLGTEGGAQWNELGVTPINSFDVFFLKPGSEYQFRVTARNRYGWGESVTTTEPISVGSVANFPPDIVRDLPGPLKALQGDNVTLECEINGDPPPTIQWLRDGQNVGTLATLKDRVFVSDDQLIHRLIIKQLTEDDSGRYVCEAVNKLGRASTYARLLVVTDPRLLDADRKLKESLLEQHESAPQLTMRLRDRRVQESYPVRLSCQVIGSPTPSVTWARQGQPIADGDRHQIVQEADHFHTLEICRTLLEDSGEYTVTAHNCLGAVSCHCQLVVDKGIRAYISPEFTAELSPAVTVREGAELRLFAQVEAYPTVSISWQRDGVRLRPSRRLVMTLDPEGRVELALAHLTVRDAGLYTCSATNAVGRAETVCQVFVTGGTPVATGVPTITTSNVPYSKEPRFVTKPRSSEAVEGDTVVITCEVVGDPQPEVMWLRDWLKPGYYRDAPQFRQAAGGTAYSLEIPQVKLDFTGTYCVIARNSHGEAKAIISLQIYAKGQGKESSMVSGHVKHGQVETLPEIKRELRDLRCCDGDAVTLECLVTATPLPSVRWEKDGKILPLGEDIEAELDGEIARLTIKKVYPEDEGQYSCVAYNDLGRAVTSACLVVDVPEEKETLLSQQLTRPPGLLSARSTPRSTPRNTPSPARSLSPTPARYREFSSPSFSRPKRVKMSSPKFYTVPHNRIAEEGETVRFQCSVAGHPTPWASWDKDGHIVTPSSRLSVTERDDLRTLELREVTVEDAGLYRVTLENEMGSIEATARLDIIGRQGSRTRSVRAWSAMRSSPTFGRRLVGSAARVGGTFTLTCDVHASPSPVTSWYRNGEMLVKSPRVVPSWDGRRARLELRSLQPEDAGVYTCVAENAVGTTQCSAELRILQTTDPSDADLQPPVFLQGLSPEQTAAEGQPFELQVRLQGSSPLEVVWVKDGVELPDCSDLHHVDYGDGRFGLRIADVFVADGGIYNCEAFNDHGDAITSGHLIVNDMSGGEGGSTEPEIMFTKTPSPVLARLRGQASFCARLQSRPLSHTSFTWTLNGRSVNNDDRFTVTTEEDCSILHVAEVCPCDIGAVVCTAKVCSPSVPPTTVSCDTTLGLDPTPGAPAVLLRGPCDTTAMRGDRVLLKATYRGDPEPSVRWLKAGRELSSEGRVQIASRDGVSCLTISAIDADDSGKYVVSVENVHGADCHFASVAVEGPPEAPAARPSVSLAGEGCVTVAWSSPPYDGGCVITGYRVEMRTALSHQWSVVADRCHSLSHVVRGLTPGQTYLFRVRAENIHGASESSAESFPFILQSPHAGLREEEGEGEGDVESDAVLEPRLVTLEPGDQFLERYSVHEELGKGRYGVVHKVTDLRTGHTMAAKFVRCIKKQDREKAQEEIDIMNRLRHPKLLQLAAAFDNPKDMVMVMEYISGGELFERVVADDFTLTERDCILFLRQICEGVRYMHTCNVVHLDLKPENIMCHTRTSHRVKIIDFGLAQKLQSNTPVRVLFGTPEFIPPEIINYEPIGVESDMWSVGVICYVLLSGLSPFMGDNDAETFANITRADFDFDDEAFEAISQDAKDFISSLLIKRKEKRLTAEECLKHKWLTQSDTTMSSVKLCTDKLKKFIIRRKWQKTGNAIRALGRMATLSAASRRNSSASSPPSPRPSLSASRMSSLGEETTGDRARGRVCSERSDSGISDCSSINTNATPPGPRHLLNKKYSICEEPEDDPSSCRLTEHGVTVNKLCDGVNGKATSDVSAAAKKRTTNSLRLDSEPAKAPSPTLQKDAKLFGKSENFQKAFAFWKQ